MTTLGKILVIVNFVFSLVAAGLIIAVHSASTNWHSLSDAYKKQLTVAQENAETYKGEIDRVRSEEGEKVKTIARQLGEAAGERDTARAEAKSYAEKYDKAVSQGKDVDSNRQSITAEVGRLKTEVNQLNSILALRDKKMLDMEKEKRELRDQKVSAEIAAKAEQERNLQLLTQNEQLTKEIQRGRSSGASGRLADRNPPPVDVDGLVKAIDKQSGYMTLSIGSDAGLSRGDTLEVFREKPEGRYLGTVRILEVRSNEAVAKSVIYSQGRTPIQVGDRVASNITVPR